MNKILNLKKNHIYPFLISIITVFVFLLIFLSNSGEEERSDLKVGFVTPGSIDGLGWNNKHYEGIQAACKEKEVELMVCKNIPESTGECPAAVKYLIESGCKLIFLNSYNYAAEIQDMVSDYRGISFYANFTDYSMPNLSSYFCRVYQARYLSGILAGLSTKTGRIGYVAAFPNNEVLRGINAFTLGVRRVNPSAKVIVKYSGAWDAKDRETEAVSELIRNTDIDLITYHQNEPYVAQAAVAMGMDCIAYNGPVELNDDHLLGCVISNWKFTYGDIIRMFYNGKANQDSSYWEGIDVEAVDLEVCSKRVPESVKKVIEEVRQEFMSGGDVFTGRIYDNKGGVRCDSGECLSDEVLFNNMDWYVEGVVVYEDK